MLDFARRRCKIAHFETDDLIFEPALVQHDSYYRSLTPTVAQEYLRNIYLNLEMLKRCDYVLTTTDYLARALQQHKPALIIRNAVGVEDQDWVAHFCIAGGKAYNIGAGHLRSGCAEALRDSGARYVRIRRCSRASCQRLWYDWIQAVAARLGRQNP